MRRSATPSSDDRPPCLKNPRPEGAESTLTENVASPFHAEPGHFQREAKNPVPIKIGDVLDNVIALYERKIESAGIQVEKQVDFEGEFIGLPGEMRQVFANLIGNAIEAIGKNGKIRLHAYASSDWSRGRCGLRVTVADNGPGIPAEVRDKIFEPFFTTKGEGGTGLGL